MTLRLLFIYCCIFSCVIPIGIGIMYFRYLNSSLKVFFYWLIFNLVYAITSAFFVPRSINYFLEFINICVSFWFLYMILKQSWQKRVVNRAMLGLFGFVIIISIIEIVIFFNELKAHNNYSVTTQTLIWVVVSFYYLKRLLGSHNMVDIGKYPLFWIGISNFLSSIITLFYFFITNSALRFSKHFYYVIENIAYSSVLGMYVLFAIGLYVTKNGIREIIKV